MKSTHFMYNNRVSLMVMVYLWIYESDSTKVTRNISNALSVLFTKTEEKVSFALLLLLFSIYLLVFFSLMWLFFQRREFPKSDCRTVCRPTRSSIIWVNKKNTVCFQPHQLRNHTAQIQAVKRINNRKKMEKMFGYSDKCRQSEDRKNF